MGAAFLGEIVLFAGNFAPTDWAFCDGQLLSIARHRALFSILGTTYGGDGRRKFALPDLRGRVPLCPGGGHILGEQGGEEMHTLAVGEMPLHSHGVNAVRDTPNAARPTNNMLADGNFYNNGPASTTMNPNMIAPAGSNEPHNNMQPYLGLTYIICIKGLVPSPS